MSKSAATTAVDPGVLDLDDDLGAVVERGDVRLRDRRRRERLEVERANASSSGRPRSASTVARTTSGGVGRHVGLQLAQLERHLEPDQVDPRAQHLAELDERRAELGQRLAQPLPVAERAGAGAHGVGHEVAEPRADRDVEHLGDAVVRQHAQDLLDAPAVLDEDAGRGMRRRHARDPTLRSVVVRARGSGSGVSTRSS